MAERRFIMTNGAEPIAVPLQSEFGDRDHLALAMLIAAPLINYLRLRSQHRWVQVSLVALMVMIIIAVLATSSYGGFFSLLAMGIFFLVAIEKAGFLPSLCSS